jgi:hypothetical protein
MRAHGDRQPVGQPEPVAEAVECRGGRGLEATLVDTGHDPVHRELDRREALVEPLSSDLAVGIDHELPGRGPVDLEELGQRAEEDRAVGGREQLARCDLARIGASAGAELGREEKARLSTRTRPRPSGGSSQVMVARRRMALLPSAGRTLLPDG